MDYDNSTSIEYYSKVLDVLTERHRAIANNVANVNTPGYKSKDIDFKSVLNQITSIKNELPANSSSIADEFNNIDIVEITSGDGYDNKGLNDVDMDKEMVNLATNTMIYKLYVQKLMGTFNQLKSAVRGGV